MPHPRDGQHQHDGRQRQPRGCPGRRARIKAGAAENRLDGLVGGIDRAAGPAGLEDDGRPVPHRVVSGQQEAGRTGDREGDGGRSGGPPVAAAQEEQHEHCRGQLHRGGEADQHAARPAHRGRQAVQRYQRHQRHVDLAVVQRVPHRFKEQRYRQQPANRPPRSRLRSGGGTEEHPQHQGGQGDAGQRDHRAVHGQRRQRERRQQHRGDRGIAEREPRAAAGRRQGAVEIPAV